jgi:hypothetical protein
VSQGEPFYSATAHELSARGYQHSSPLNWRLPTLIVFEAALPSLLIAQVLLVAIVIFAAASLAAQLPRTSADLRLATLAALGSTLPIWLAPRTVAMSEIWTGALVALSLALWRPHRVWPSVVAGLLAALVRELTLIYFLAMVVVAVATRRRREALAWGAAIVFGMTVVAVHARLAAPFLQPGPANGWMAFGGPEFVMAAWRANPAALFLPSVSLVLLVPASLVGLWVWRHPASAQIATTVTLFAAVFLVVGRPDNWYWGFVVAPLWPLGLVGFGDRLVTQRRVA